ncbi:hypothetical protein TNCV_278161 [Trichonephila clavipes]|nr:hypothetical protein TNCV_278161 [Trichonephila clavipes]
MSCRHLSSLRGVSPSLNCTVTCMVLKANDRRTSCPYHDEFRGPRSDYVRQEALATTTTSRLLVVLASIAFICATETSRNITARVIERDTRGDIYYFLEDSKGFRTRQSRQLGRQK